MVVTAKEVREFVKLMAVWHPKGYSGTSLHGEWVVLDPVGGKGYHSADQEIIVRLICQNREIPYTLEPGTMARMVLVLVGAGGLAIITGAALMYIFNLSLFILAAIAAVAATVGGVKGYLDTRGGYG